MELEELKKSWNALDEHLKDKEFIKEEEPFEKPIRHADKGIHAIASLNIKAYSDFFADIDLVFSGGVVAQQIEPDLHHYHFRMDSCPLLGYRHHPFPPTDTNRRDAFGRSNQPRKPYPPMDHQRTADCHCFSLLVLAVLSFIYWQVWQYGIGMIAFFILLWGRRTRIDFMDLPQEVLKSHPRNKKKNLSELNELM